MAGVASNRRPHQADRHLRTTRDPACEKAIVYQCSSTSKRDHFTEIEAKARAAIEKADTKADRFDEQRKQLLKQLDAATTDINTDNNTTTNGVKHQRRLGLLHLYQVLKRRLVAVV